jgi:hypothetical protein
MVIFKLINGLDYFKRTFTRSNFKSKLKNKWEQEYF